MELLKLSKFKLQLRAIAIEVGDLREREHSATEQCRILIQKQKQTEEQYYKQLLELRSELASSYELRQKLKREVSCLQNDNALLENKHKELLGTIQTLLQSRESFLNAYEESTSKMRRSIEARDRKLVLLSENINSHHKLFDSIEKEAFSIKQFVNKVQLLVSEKEEIERINNLENKLKINEDEFCRKDRIISELDEQLEVAELNNTFPTPIEELQITLSAKDALIQNLISEKEALHCEVGTLSLILQKIQETVMNMNEEDKRMFSTLLNFREGCDMALMKENTDR